MEEEIESIRLFNMILQDLRIPYAAGILFTAF